MPQLNWQRDELLLACDLLAQNDWRQPGTGDPRIVELSSLLRRLPTYSHADRPENFRSPGSVRRKLGNLVTADDDYPDDKGRTRGAWLDAVVRREYLADRVRMEQEAQAIRQVEMAGGFELLPVSYAELSDDPGAVEGRLLVRLHTHRERNGRLRRKRIAQAGDALACEVCGFDFATTYGAHGRGYIECHHILPLHVSGETQVRTRDLALLCANCHRMIHRSPEWLSLEQLRQVLDDAEALSAGG
jgi:5-methylcytosine-specific restriction protein A